MILAIRAKVIAAAEIALEAADEPERVSIRIGRHRSMRDIRRHVVLTRPFVGLGVIRIDAPDRIVAGDVSAQLVHLAAEDQALRLFALLWITCDGFPVQRIGMESIVARSS